MRAVNDAQSVKESLERCFDFRRQEVDHTRRQEGQGLVLIHGIRGGVWRLWQ